MIPTAKLSLLLNALLAFSTVSVYGAPIQKREVPQEHSHEKYLTSVRTSLQKNNPDQIADPVFGLLGNAAASQGLGKITDPDCLHQATADQAFTNAKADGDVQGMVDALIFRALERNTGRVGLASVLCTAIQAKNPEIAAISQHQDPASPNAAATNKAIVLELAKQIASVGGDPQQALESGTFAPGDVNDATGKGNSCDDQPDPVGCIFTKNLLVPDATPEEIDAAVAGVSAGSTDAATATTTSPAAASTVTAAPTDAVDDSGADDTVTVTVTVTVTAGAADATETATETAAATTTAAAESTASSTPTAEAAATTTKTTAAAAATTTSSASSGANLQKFTDALGGVTAPAVTQTGSSAQPFCVAGNSCFNNLQNALIRSCDVQHNKCANFANGAGQNPPFSVGDCGEQQTECIDLARSG